jgi:RHS repeat-associated protein
VDDLTYTYTTSNNIKTNQLLQVSDAGVSSSAVDDYPGTVYGASYTYDANGNMISDEAKDLHLYYHRTLNLPQMIVFGQDNRLFYHYTATGAKLIKHTQTASSTENYTHYIGNIVYNGGTLAYIITEEGRMVAIGTGADRTFAYEYNIKDHLGNARATFTGSNLGGSVDVVQTTNYYPFGLVMNQSNSNTSSSFQKNKYLYNGKELQDDKMTSEAMNLYDYGARFYDPQIGRWTTIDPKAEKFIKWSPYNYCYDNPINYIDPDGNETIETPDPNKTYKKQDVAYVYTYNGVNSHSVTQIVNTYTYTADKDGNWTESTLATVNTFTFSSKDGNFTETNCEQQTVESQQSVTMISVRTNDDGSMQIVALAGGTDKGKSTKSTFSSDMIPAVDKGNFQNAIDATQSWLKKNGIDNTPIVQANKDKYSNMIDYIGWAMGGATIYNSPTKPTGWILLAGQAIYSQKQKYDEKPEHHVGESIRLIPVRKKNEEFKEYIYKSQCHFYWVGIVECIISKEIEFNLTFYSFN